MSGYKQKISAVVVTYNRLALLKRVVASLAQIEKLAQVIVVDNGSTDGTADWLDGQQGLTVVHQANVGGSGGFHTGIELAHRNGAEWIWCMDDDVFPQPDCLDRLLSQASDPQVGILCPRRVMGGEVFVNECRRIDTSRMWHSLHQERLTADVAEPTAIEGMVFEGPLISRAVVDKIGLPNKDLFIFYDDTDYSYRATLAGFRVVYVPDAVMQKEKFFTDDTWATKLEKKRWKHLYQLRNAAYFNHHYGRTAGVRYGRALFTFLGYAAGELLYMVKSCKNTCPNIRRLWRAYRCGVREQLTP